MFGLFVGAATGSVVFLASNLSGWPLFTLAGGAAGVIAALLVHAYSGTARLSSVTLTIPQMTQMEFTVTRDSQQVAWKIFVEVATRVSTQRMDQDSGRMREALDSLYSLFQALRDLLKTIEPRSRRDEPSVEQLAIGMLNLELRPFLSRWHPELSRWENHQPGADESTWPRNAECRADLAGVQERIGEYALGFAQLARMPESVAERILGRGDSEPFPASG
ncbi:gas vesicle protein [Nocardiopsis arvandica]|uniref:Gas vesicle protein n=1 Tax=Nocardiopsis sinuspersici TaxID=501010 RepID=A0A7Y9X9X6_9ACTN|nr:hypothetical protein [Nocardiopsis sinuspersici]NYH50435.1 gas vesicle protein [Nocardiopsis sinuspersici]